MYTSVSADFKNECKQNVNEYKRIAKIHVVEDNIDITNDDVLVDFTIEEIAHSNGTFVGNTVAKKITLNIINDGSYNLENKEIQVYVGVDYEGDGSDEELVPYGNFIISKPTNEEVKDASNYVGYDYMMKAEKPYVEGNITYPISLYNYLSAVCSGLSITLGNSSIPNGSYSVLGNAYTNGESYRQVIEDIAKCCGGFAVIGRDNKLYIRTLDVANLKNLTTEDSILIETEDEFELVSEKPTLASGSDNYDSENLTPDEYFDDFSTANSYGPVNKVALALNENVIGEDTIMQDSASIAENGVVEIRICDIAFLNSEAQRQLCIAGVYNVLHNLNYTPFSVNYYGYPYIDSGDFIILRSVKSGREYYSYALNHTFTYNGGFSGKIEAPALTDVEDEYKATTDAKNAYRHTELRVNKIDGKITSIVEEIGDRTGKTTSITQDVDRIDSLVQETIDITREAEGNAPLTLENCMNGYLLELHIYGNNDVFSCLYPANDLYPSDTLYPKGDSRVHIWTDNICPSIEWENKVLNADGTTTDSAQAITSPYIPVSELEIYISLENPSYKINKVCAYDNSKALLSGTTEEIVEENYEEIVTLPSGTKFIRFEVQQNYLQDIAINEAAKIKPMVVYGDEKIDYCGYNDTILDLGITSVLRRFVNAQEEVIRDEYVLMNNRGVLIRRVGMNNGVPYELPTEETTDLGDIYIPVAEGKNYFDIVNYSFVPCKARYVIINEYTSTFATTVQLTSEITQLADEINLTVSQKVDETEFLSTIQLLVNEISAKVSNSEFTSALQILANQISAKVSQNDIVASLNLGVSQGQGIIEIIGNLIKITTDYFKIKADGTIEATGGKIASFNINANAIESESCGMSSNQHAAFWCKIAGQDTYKVTWNGDIACSTILVDGSPLIKTVAGAQEIKSCYADSGQLVFTLSNAIWVVLPDGGGSDARLKKNIKDTKINALKDIEQMHFTEFDWKGTDEYQDIGLIAQELEKINPNFVTDLKYDDKEQKIINNPKLIFYALKGVQELSKKVDKQQEEIDELKKIIEEMKKGEK